MPNCSPIHCKAPALRAGSCRTSTTSRVARYRNSFAYFLGQTMTLILLGIASLHQTRGATLRLISGKAFGDETGQTDRLSIDLVVKLAKDGDGNPISKPVIAIEAKFEEMVDGNWGYCPHHMGESDRRYSNQIICYVSGCTNSLLDASVSFVWLGLPPRAPGMPLWGAKGINLNDGLEQRSLNKKRLRSGGGCSHGLPCLRTFQILRQTTRCGRRFCEHSVREHELDPARQTQLGSVQRLCQICILGRHHQSDRLGRDRVAAPWITFALVVMLIPPLASSEVLFVVLGLAALVVSFAILRYDISELKRFLYTSGFGKVKLQLIDPADDTIPWKVRLQPKSIQKLMMVKHKMLDISEITNVG